MAAGRTIRSLLVRLGVTTDKAAVESFNTSIASAKSLMFSASAAAAAFTATVLGTVAATWAAVAASTDHAEALKQQADALGITTDEMQELRHVFDQFPPGAEGTVQVMGRLNLSIGNLRKGAGEAAEGFQLLGLNASDFKGLGLPESLERVAQGFADQTDKQKRLLAVQRIFGDELAARVAPALEQGASGIQALRRAAVDLGLVLDQRTVDSLERVKGQMQAVRGVVRNLAYRVGAALAPAIDVATESFLRWYEANSAWIRLRFEDATRTIRAVFQRIGRYFSDTDRWVRDNLGGWEKAFAQLGKAIVAIGLPTLLGAIAVAAVAAGAAIIPVVTSIGAPFLLFAAAVGVVVAGMAALLIAGEDLYQWLRGGDSVFGRYMEWLGINEQALRSVREALAALRNTGMAFVDFVDAALMPLGGMDGALNSVASAVSYLWRTFWAFAGNNAIIPAIDYMTEHLQMMEVVLEAITGWMQDLPTFADRWGDSLRRVGGMISMVGEASPDLGPLSPAAGARAAGNLATQAGQTLMRQDVTNVGDVTVSVTEPGASPEEVGRAVSDALASAFRSARQVAIGSTE